MKLFEFQKGDTVIYTDPDYLDQWSIVPIQAEFIGEVLRVNILAKQCKIRINIDFGKGIQIDFTETVSIDKLRKITPKKDPEYFL